MDTEKINEYKTYLQTVISGNARGVLGTRAVLNNAPSKKISTITGVLKIPQDEEIIIFFDDTLMGSGKEGLVLTSWGLHYKVKTKWDISWEEIAEKFNHFAIEGTEGIKNLKIRNGQGNDFSIEKEIFLTMASFDLEWLKRILFTGCRIFTGKKLGDEQEVRATVSSEMNQEPVSSLREKNETSKSVQNNAEPEAGLKASAKLNGEGVVVYKDWKMLILVPIIIIAAPIYGIYSGISDGNFGSANHILWLILCCAFSVVCYFYHKYLRGGIIIDLNARIISFPKVNLLAFFRPYPRNDISFDEITEIQAINKADVQGNTAATLKFIMTYKFVIHGAFGSKTVSFRNREKRDQFFSLLATYGNFS